MLECWYSLLYPVIFRVRIEVSATRIAFVLKCHFATLCSKQCILLDCAFTYFEIQGNAVPTWLTGIKYDAEKEEKYLQDNKQKELARIEEALKKAAEKGTKLMQTSDGIWEFTVL